MSYSDEFFKRLKIEIETDPEKRGYAGKTDKEVCDLLNGGYTITKTIEDPQGPRVYAVISGIPYTQNVIKESEVSMAKAYTI